MGSRAQATSSRCAGLNYPVLKQPNKPKFIAPFAGRGPGDVLRTNPPWEATRDLLLTYFWVFHGLKVRGIKNVPTGGPVIFTPNHVSYYDPPIVAACVPYRVRTMAWEKLFHVPVLNWLIRQYGAFPVKLKSADKSAVAESLRILKNHEALIVFPEGERGASGSLQEFEKGVARVAMQTGAAIVPVTITGAYEAFSRKHHLPHWFKRITIKFHPAIHVAASDSREGLREKIEKLNDAIACPIRRRLNAYNRLRKKQQS